MEIDRLNKQIPVPLYYQLKQLILNDIKEKKYKENDSIPTEAELSSFYKISKPTVKRAIDELVNDGYLYRLRGKGTFLSKPKLYQVFAQVIQSFNDDMKNLGFTPKTKVLNFCETKVSHEIEAALNIEAGKKVFRLDRLRYADDEPLLIAYTFIPCRVFPNLMDYNFEEHSLYEVFGYRGINIKRVRRTFEAKKPTEKETQLLGMKKGEPVHYFETVAYDSNDIPVEFSIHKYKGDRNRFIIEIVNKDA